VPHTQRSRLQLRRSSNSSPSLITAYRLFNDVYSMLPHPCARSKVFQPNVCRDNAKLLTGRDLGEGDLLGALRHLDQSTSAARFIAGLFLIQ